jgi:hypothetical protein
MQRAAIRDVFERYFCSLDLGDIEALAACFTPAVSATYQLGRPEERTHMGRDSLVRQLAENRRRRTSSIHSLGNVDITLNGDRAATAVTHAVATLVGDGRVMVRGLRYEDRLVCEDGTWRISARMHVPLWQYDVSLAPLAGATPVPTG